MNSPIIKVRNLSKCYRIGQRERYETFREAIIKTCTAPLRNLRQLRRLTKFNDLEQQIPQNTDTSESTVAPTRRNYNEREDDVIWALKNVSFEVGRGEVIGIIGRNGAGKTTLLKILSRITGPTKGDVKLWGRVSSLLDVGTGFHYELTGRENIYLNGSTLGMSKAEIKEKFDEIVAFAEIEKFIDTPVKRYSSGMYVRLAFAVAAHLEPEILLVDEVLAVGDITFQKKCLGKMKTVGQEGRTVLLVSHNMPSIMNICQRTILLDLGEIKAYGDTPEVIQKYMSTSRSAGGQVTWTDHGDAPGNEIVRLRAVRILQNGIDGPTADVNISEEIVIEIEYVNLQEKSVLCAGILLKDGVGTQVFASHNAPSVSLTKDHWYGAPHPRGIFRSTCRIPGDFFNSGTYSITAILALIPNRTIVWEEDLLSFHVHDTGLVYQPGGGRWAGVVRPRLPWHTEHVGPISQ